MTAPRPISPAEAFKLQEQGVPLVDVRSELEFAELRPAQSTNLPWKHQSAGGMEANPRFVEVALSGFDKSKPIILACRSGNRSHHAGVALIEAGFAEVYNQRAGMAGKRDGFGSVLEPGWRDAQLPTASGPPADSESYSGLLAKLGLGTNEPQMLVVWHRGSG